jgi:phosphomannomutase
MEDSEFGPGSLRAALDYVPKELGFGTSGRRGDVVDLTQLEVFINAIAEIEYLLSLPESDGGISTGSEFYYAFDLRPSSTRFAAEEQGRGEIAQAVARAIREAGLRPVNLGAIPTPALMAYALARRRASIMITGSHIPFERNGYKTNTSRGELLKKDEAPIGERVAATRKRVFAAPFAQSPFDARGMFKSGHAELDPEDGAGRAAYLDRYARFFGENSLNGMRIVVYQHSAVGRDMLVEMLTMLGARVAPAGRSDRFVPIDTENIDAEQLAAIQSIADAAEGPVDAIVSTDGDSDRPLILAVEDGRVRFFGGDLVGMVVAEYLNADAVVVPISCNDAIDRGALARRLQPKTRIGSPHVIAGMEKALAAGKRAVCGWEANGGFLLGSDVERGGHALTALPTRDAFLPILAVLANANDKRLAIGALFEALPKRFSKAALLKRFPRPTSLRIVAKWSPADERIADIAFADGAIKLVAPDGSPIPETEAEMNRAQRIREGLARYFTASDGFSAISRLNYIDGVRIAFENGDIAHIRPSGNADELRIYAVADTQSRADQIAALGVAEPNGILRRLADDAG